jgi:hypothetical protein
MSSVSTFLAHESFRLVGVACHARIVPLPRRVLGLLLAASVAACSTLPSANRTAATVPSGSPTAPSPAAASPQLPAFELVLKDAKRTDAILPVWRREDRTWLELPADIWDKPMFLSLRLTSGIGESGLFGGLMASRYGVAGKPQIVTLRRVGNQVQLLALNAAYFAQPDVPAQAAVKSAYSPSLLGSTPVASAPHPTRGSVLVDAQALFVTDMPGIAMLLNRAFRQNYAHDARNSSITAIQVQPHATTIEVTNHYATPSLSSATPGAPLQPGAPATVPDARSLFIGVAYDLSRLPQQPMSTRTADQRVGYFTTTVSDFSRDLDRRPRKFFINHWRLEPKTPEAKESAQADATAPADPVEPIVFWLDRSIPVEYRQAITDGALEWNKAFERAGWRNVVQVRQQPADSTVDAATLGRASIRWMTNSNPSFGAIGPSHVDPRSGEILRAHIAIESLSSRAIRSLRSQILAPQAHEDGASQRCEQGDLAAEQLGYALDTLSAHGGLDPDDPQVQRFVLAYLKDTTMHEVGHALGLRHNFRASGLRPLRQLADAALTETQGLSASVMDYAAINLPAPGQTAGAPFQTTLGAYDYWAIEYGYKRFPVAREQAELAAVAARADDPAWRRALAYGTDEDYAGGIDPQSLQFDLGDDPLAFARQRVAIAQDLLSTLASRPLRRDEDYSILRRTATYALRDLARTSVVVTRQIGGVSALRDYPGSGRDPLQPVPAATQAQALDLLSRNYLCGDCLLLPPALARKLPPDFLDRVETDPLAAASASGASWNQLVLELQRGVLAPLLSEDLLGRLVDQGELEQGHDRFTPARLLGGLTAAVWSASADSPARRNLQRDYVNRLALLVLRPAIQARADTRAQVRDEAQRLLARLRNAQRHAAAGSATKLHLSDCADTLQRALDAPLQRGGF